MILSALSAHINAKIPNSIKKCVLLSFLKLSGVKATLVKGRDLMERFD